jgi:hypothetical protein
MIKGGGHWYVLLFVFSFPLPNMVQRLFADVINDAIWFMHIHEQNHPWFLAIAHVLYLSCNFKSVNDFILQWQHLPTNIASQYFFLYLSVINRTYKCKLRPHRGSSGDKVVFVAEICQRGNFTKASGLTFQTYSKNKNSINRTLQKLFGDNFVKFKDITYSFAGTVLANIIEKCKGWVNDFILQWQHLPTNIASQYFFLYWSLNFWICLACRAEYTYLPICFDSAHVLYLSCNFKLFISAKFFFCQNSNIFVL